MRFIIFMIAATAAAALNLFLVSRGAGGAVLADPLVVVGVIAWTVAMASFVAGWITDDYSWVDRVWSIAPAVYVWIYAVMAWPDPRLIVMAALVTLWGARLTYNFARKGGYGAMEDYRWVEVRKRITAPLAWQAFNLLFISVYQNLLFVLFTLPAYWAWRMRGEAAGIGDAVIAALFIVSLVFETAADQQQWNFYAARAEARAGKRPLEGDLARGFLTSGLFRYSRHPNFFFEQANWWIFYLFAVAASGQWLSLAGLGALLLTLLFQGSTALTERISASKYPAYAEYRKTTSRIIPWLPGSSRR